MNVPKLHPTKLMNSSLMDMFKKKNIPAGIVLLAIKKEKGQEHAAKKQLKPAKTPSKPKKKNIVLSSFYE